LRAGKGRKGQERAGKWKIFKTGMSGVVDGI